jgi:hypothetical protein
LQDHDDDIQSLLNVRELSIQVLNSRNARIADVWAAICHANAEKARASAVLCRDSAKLEHAFEARKLSLRTSSETNQKTFKDEQTVLEKKHLRVSFF